MLLTDARVAAYAALDVRTPYYADLTAQTSLRRYARNSVYTPRVDLGAYVRRHTQ